MTSRTEDAHYISDVPGTEETPSQEDEPLIDGSAGSDGFYYNMKILIISLLIILVGGGCGLGIWLIVVAGGDGYIPDAPFQLVNRSTWGALKPKNITYYPNPPPKLAVIIHTDGLPCSNQAMCSEELRDIQKSQMKIFDDIAYNFLIGGDGKTYEGRSWDVKGAFAGYFNNVSFGIAFIGTFETEVPPQRQLQEAKALLSVAVEKKKLHSDYVLVGHRQLEQTLSPGTALYNVIKTWPHWKDCYKDSCLKHLNRFL